jgi:hypothetical protein
MMITQEIQILTEAIKHKYKSLEQPDFSFVNKAISLRPYEFLIQKIRNLFEVEELTDSNDDVSFRYLLSKSKKQQWVVELSMLGRFATILRIPEVGPIRVVSKDTSVQEERDIVSLLMENQFKILDQQVLEQPFPLRLFNTAPENVCIYQALFSDTDVLPWRAGIHYSVSAGGSQD